MILLVKSPGLILETKVIVYTGRLAVKYWQRKIQNQDGSHGTAQKKKDGSDGTFFYKNSTRRYYSGVGYMIPK